MSGLLRLVSFVLVLGWSVPVLAASDYEDGVRELTKAIVAEAGKLNKQNLAVVDFTDLQGNVTALGRFLAEELSGALVMAGGIQVVDRNQLNKIFQEHSLSMLGISDPEAVKKVGKVAGADALITGSITEMADSVRVTAKVMATDTARVIAAAKTTIPKTSTIADLVKQGVEAPGAKPSEKSAKKPTTVSKTVPAQAAMKIDAHDFLFSLQECKKSGPQITCSLLITNQGKDRELQIHADGGCVPGASRLFDSTGNVYKASRATLGNASGTCWGAGLSMVSNIPTGATLLFDETELPEDATHTVAMLEVVFGYGYKDKFWGQALNKEVKAVQFRDVPLTQ